ncbi:hypothetical protein U9M48_011251 [Paspalum notatum var. saurae]|uniref:Gem-associated protein 2 n=1 Tax=Paspalum notatum var. saurae TaxID=547442 RepID=A0AAQ3WGZ2_PASNO
MAASPRRRTSYARAELEALRGSPSEDAQAKLWAEVRAALAAAGFSREYDGLLAAQDSRITRPPGNNNKGRAAAARVRKEWAQETPPLEARFLLDEAHTGAHASAGVCEVIDEPFPQGEDVVDCEDDSDDDYDGILKPAFAVDGDPDFDSGEPLDGFEYIRRVRWEANQIPRVTVAKIDLTAARKEQTPYMPEIPDIPKCSPDLCASKQWEDAFVTDFTKTRLIFSELDSSDEPSGVKKVSLKPGTSSEPQTDPTLTMLRNMDAVSRAATLRNYIDMIQSLDALSRNNCLWLFALCAAIESPLDAETCASLRSMLRKCATILAAKTAMDDEVAMLSILMTISGRYFGQYENRSE